MNNSYADIAEHLANKVNKWSEKAEVAQDSIEKTTAQRMLDRSMGRVQDLEKAFLTDFTADNMEKMGSGQASGQGGLPTAAKGSPFMETDAVDAASYGVSALLSLMDNAKNKKVINAMQAPQEPLKYTAPRLNTSVDVSAQEGALRDQMNSFRDNARRTHGSAGSRSAAVLKGLDASSRGMNQIYSTKANQEGQLRNQQAAMNMQADVRNTQTQNQHLQMITDFNNGKQMAYSQNYANSINDLMLMTKDFNQRRTDKKKFNTMLPLWDKDGIHSAFYGN